MNGFDLKNKEPIFVVGFPKSGNTWLARLLAEITESVIDATNSVDAADNTQCRKGNYLIFKLHDFESVKVPDGARVVYIIRDIRDVLVSAFFFNNKFIREDWVKLNSRCGLLRRLLCKAYFRHQIDRMNKRWCGNELSLLLNWIYGKKNMVGSWSNHLVSWGKNSDVVVVRYEDLLQNTEGEMRRILDVMGIKVSDKALKESISNQSFENKKLKFQKSDDSKNVQFLRSGKTGGWRDYLSPAMLKKIETRHFRVMNEYGYKLESYKGEK